MTTFDKFYNGQDEHGPHLIDPPLEVEYTPGPLVPLLEGIALALRTPGFVLGALHVTTCRRTGKGTVSLYAESPGANAVLVRRDTV